MYKLLLYTINWQGVGYLKNDNDFAAKIITFKG